ncbi:hypothetical protein Tco_0320772 [Tanacetum coccineum]
MEIGEKGKDRWKIFSKEDMWFYLISEDGMLKFLTNRGEFTLGRFGLKWLGSDKGLIRDISTGFEDISTGFEEVNTGWLRRDSSSQKKLKEQIQQEEASYAKPLRLQLLEEEEATKAQLKDMEKELQTEISKKQRIDDKDVSDTEEKVGKVKEEEPVKRVGKRKKQKARTLQERILLSSYGWLRRNYGTNRLEMLMDSRVLWSDLRTMFDPPLNEDAIWSLPLQQKMINRKYPSSKMPAISDVEMKLLDGKYE